MAIYVSKRPRLSSSNSLSPFQQNIRWIQNNLTVLLMAVGCIVLWLGLVFLICVIYRFLAVNVAQIYQESEISVSQVWTFPTTEAIKIVGGIISFIMVIRSSHH